MYDDKWQLDFWWWTWCSLSRSWNIMAYSWNLHNGINKCYLSKNNKINLKKKNEYHKKKTIHICIYIYDILGIIDGGEQIWKWDFHVLVKSYQLKDITCFMSLFLGCGVRPTHFWICTLFHTSCVTLGFLINPLGPQELYIHNWDTNIVYLI